MTLAEICIAARKEGLTYGQYVLKHNPHTSRDEIVPPKQRCCIRCGKPIAPSLYGKGGKQYCSDECQLLTRLDRDDARVAQNKAKKKKAKKKK